MDARSDAGRDLDEFGQDIGFQRRFWRAERVAWLFYVILILTALLGLTGGGGPLAHAKAETPDGTVEYPRISRWQASDNMTVHVNGRGPADIELGSGFIDAFEIESVHPEPVTATATSNGIRYSFAVEGGGEIVFQLQARRPAFLPDAGMRIGGSEVRLRPLILP